MGSSSRSSKKSKSIQPSTQRLIDSLLTHRVNTLTELCRIERTAANCQNEEEAQAFQEPMTAAWNYYVTSHQLLTELRGLTRNYPFNGDIVTEALNLVQNDPDSNRSWNLAWLCLVKIRDNGLIPTYAEADSWRPEMWGGRNPSQSEADQLYQCFAYEWTQAVENMLRHWSTDPVWC
ncbi:hypothetical protein F4778DRAFT_579052 [Xylariomycetidae sp. FL2044]|nr:hypothetical protein F4778DRAFT_579052 [Xylariomycetidae sp. FL2044]